VVQILTNTMAIVNQINNFRIFADFKSQAKSGDLNPEKTS